jgi:hypothetical protein
VGPIGRGAVVEGNTAPEAGTVTGGTRREVEQAATTKSSAIAVAERTGERRALTP